MIITQTAVVTYKYFFDPLTRKRVATPGDGQPWYVELTAEEYEAVGLLGKPGGYAALMSAAFKCGIDLPQSNKHEAGYCQMCDDWKIKAVAFHPRFKDWTCREHYEKAVKVAEMEQ